MGAEAARVARATLAVRGRLHVQGPAALARVGVILGSGLGSYADTLDGRAEVSFEDVPGIPLPTVAGHKGAFILGSAAGVPVLALRGRLHFYEGHDLQDVALPVRVLARLGVRALIVTNAAGGIDPSFAPGDLMLIDDHMNLSGRNPLIGAHEAEFGPRFPDMSAAYDPALRAIAVETACAEGVPLRRGVYSVLGGPSYETPSEVRALRAVGAGACGMSTVFEVVVARQMGVRVLGISLITNHAAGVTESPLSHEEVLETGRRAEPRFCRLVAALIPRLAAAVQA